MTAGLNKITSDGARILFLRRVQKIVKAMFPPEMVDSLHDHETWKHGDVVGARSVPVSYEIVVSASMADETALAIARKIKEVCPQDLEAIVFSIRYVADTYRIRVLFGVKVKTAK